MKTRFVAAASLLAVCIAAASTGAQAQSSSPQAEQLRLQLAGYRDQRTALVQRLADVDQRIASLRTAGKPERLKAAWAERAQLRAELKAMDAAIGVMAMLSKKGGLVGAEALAGTQAELERKVANTTVALRLAREELEAARVGVSELSIEQATQAMQLAARQYRGALLTSEAFAKNREQIADAVAIAHNVGGPAGLPKKTDPGTGTTATESPGKSRKPGAVIDDPVASPQPVTDSVIDTMQAIAEGVSEPMPSEPVAAPEPVAVAQTEPAPPPEPVVASEPEPQPIAASDPQPAPTPEPDPVVAPEPQAEPIAAVDPEPAQEQQEPAPVIATDPIAAVEPEPEPAPVPAEEPAPTPVPEPEIADAGTPPPPAEEPAPESGIVDAGTSPSPAEEPAPEPEIADAGTPPPPAEEPTPAIPEEPPISEEEVDDLLAAAPAPVAPPAEEPVTEPEQPAPPADDPVAVIEPEPIVQEPDPVVPPPADDPVAAVEPPPAVQEPIAEPAPQPEQPAPIVVTGVATLSWSTPMTRANGTPLSMAELSGYEIYVVAESTGESSVITVSDPSAMNYTVGNLPPDTYHFAISAVDTDNHVSDMSPIVSKTIVDTSVASAP